ncbi:MAG: RNA polymerase sigma factor [Planctomycetaceae bacterium]
MDESEKALISRAVLGDRDALAELITQHSPELEKSLAGKIDVRWQSVLSVDDVLQETFADAIACISQFEPRGPGSFMRWLVTLALNNLRQAIRGLEAIKRGGDRTRVATEAESYVCLFERLGGTTTSPSGQVAFGEAQTALDDALEKLPENHRILISLYDLAGCSVEDTCEACGCSPGAMFMRRSRAHDLLRKLIGSAPNL